MRRFPQFQISLVQCVLFTAFCATLIVGSALPVAAKSKVKKTRPITKPKFDPDAKKVELFEAMKEKQIETKVIAKNEEQGHVLFENKTDKPLTVVLPELFVAVPVNAQFGIPGGNFPGGGGPNFGTGLQGNGAGQSIGGNFGNNSGNGNNNPFGNNNNLFENNVPGNGFFSIPPEKVVSIPFKSVCLEHGKRTPTPRTKLKLIPAEQFTEDVNLQELLTFVGNDRPNQKAVQAAVWHLTDKMSWQQLAKKSTLRLGGLGTKSYFTRIELQDAKKVIALATEHAKAREEKEEQNSKGNVQPRRIQRVSAKK